uniref:Uncharacterized protein n=1 Tax=Anguilla anguilla TaxID=7936 RepID=A0A0E9TTS9_ANGAN
MCILLVFTVACIHFPKIFNVQIFWANAADRENAE